MDEKQAAGMILGAIAGTAVAGSGGAIAGSIIGYLLGSGGNINI